MRIWERHGFVELPFYVTLALARRLVEGLRIHYWRLMYRWHIGKGVRVHLSVHIPRKIRVKLSDRVTIGEGVRFIAEFSGGLLDVGQHTNISFCLLDVTGELRIGSNCTISEDAAIYTHSHGRSPGSKPKACAVTIGEDSWICTRALILPSARNIGARSIIGPCEVIRESVPDNSIVVSDQSIGIRPNPL